MTASAPEKAAPIPADVRKLCVRIYDEAVNLDERLSIYELMERAIMQDRADQASQEERIREDERDRLYQPLHEDRGPSAYPIKQYLLRKGAMLPADRARLRGGAS